MYFGDVAATINVCEIQECVVASAITGLKRIGDRALIKVSCARVDIGSTAIWNGGEREIVSALRGAATAEQVAAVGYCGIVDLRPGSPAVQTLPNTLIEIIGIHVPDVHFAASRRTGALRNHCDFAAIDGAAAWQYGLRGAR